MNAGVARGALIVSCPTLAVTKRRKVCTVRHVVFAEVCMRVLPYVAAMSRCQQTDRGRRCKTRARACRVPSQGWRAYCKCANAPVLYIAARVARTCLLMRDSAVAAAMLFKGHSRMHLRNEDVHPGGRSLGPRRGWLSSRTRRWPLWNRGRIRCAQQAHVFRSGRGTTGSGVGRRPSDPAQTSAGRLLSARGSCQSGAVDVRGGIPGVFHRHAESRRHIFLRRRRCAHGRPGIVAQ